MSTNTEQKTDKRSASQKLADAENAIMQLFNVIDRMGRDLMVVKDALKLLNNKVDAIVKASSNGDALSDTVIEGYMVQANVDELAGKVTAMLNQGIVSPEAAVSENSFIVGAEYDAEGTLVNPRLQFALKAITPALQEKLLGAKPGDLLDLEEGKLKFKVLESYSITVDQPAQAAEAAPATTEEAPAAEAPAATEATA